ncbi:hypothetical protein ACP6PL_05545 [Dapis sp. BLCC M126]|uniref:hypothetical protein n=1 Tax=Dapis sp. BLCC M126 TaxID=3400189 RepID=UPI003CEC04FE
MILSINFSRNLNQFGRIWDSYWFQPAPILNLAICRIIIIAFQLYHIIVQNDFLGTILERATRPGAKYNPTLVVKLLSLPFGLNTAPPDWFLTSIFWLSIIAGFFSLFGFKTNFSLIVFAVGNLFLQGYVYSFGKFHHPEALMIIALLILALSPAGRVLSVDDLGKRIKLNVKRKNFTIFSITEEQSLFARWPIILLWWMFAFVYLSAAVFKLVRGGLDWLNGYTLQAYLLSDGLTWDRPLGIWLAQQHTLALIFSYVAVLYEGTFFLVLIFPRLVWLYIPMGAAFHTGIYLAQMAPFFQYIAIYSVFIPWTSIINSFSAHQKFCQEGNKSEILYNGLSANYIRLITFFCYFDWFKRLIYSDIEVRWQSLSQTHPHISLEESKQEIHILLPNGATRKGLFAIREILWRLPILWPLLPITYLPGVSTIVPKIYS